MIDLPVIQALDANMEFKNRFRHMCQTEDPIGRTIASVER